jgi:hypothetical protein
LVVEGGRRGHSPAIRAPLPASHHSGEMIRQGEALAGWADDYDAALLAAARSPPFTPSAGRMEAAR